MMLFTNKAIMVPKKKYTYDYPEQVELSRFLQTGDKTLILRMTGYSLPYISQMCNGNRKMKPNVKKAIEQITDFRKLIDEHIPKDVVLAN